MKRTTPILDVDAEAVVSLEMIKTQLRIDQSDTFEDALLKQIRSASISYCENYMAEVIVPGTFQDISLVCQSAFRIKSNSVSSISKVERTNSDGIYIEVSNSNYSSIEAVGGTKIKFTEPGEIDDYAKTTWIASQMAGGVPYDIIQVLLILIGHYYENREAVLVGISSNQLEMGVREILVKHRNHWI